MRIAFAVAGAALLTLFLKMRVKSPSASAAVIKSCVSLCFILTALVGIAKNGISLGSACTFPCLLLLGLLFGMLGDIWLDLKYAHKEGSEVYTFTGLICFLLGHIAYIIAVIHRFYIPGNALYLILAAAGFPLAALFMYFLSEKVLRMNYGKFKLITSIYGGALFSFFTFKLYLAILNKFGSSCLNLILASSVFFMVSDFILCGTYFGTAKVKKADIIVNHITYYIAQFLVAFAVAG